MAGLSNTGFLIKDLETLLAEIEADQIANIDANLNVEADSVAGQLNGIVAARLLELWELIEQVYQAAYPDTASGQALSYIAALSGTIREPALPATADFEVTYTGTPTLPVGFAVYVDGDSDSRFELLVEHVADGASPDTVTFTASTPGTATIVTAADDVIIETPVADVTAVTLDADNDYTAGSNEETDRDLRLRRDDELARPGTGTVDAIRSDMLDVDGVDTATVFENASGFTDALGLPPFSIEVLITGTATATDIRQQIFSSKPAGTEVYGDPGNEGEVLDTAGNSHTVTWSSPTELAIHVAVTLTQTNDATYVGDEAVATALVTWATGLQLGDNVYSSDIINVVADLAGVELVSASATYVKDSDPPTGSYAVDTTPRELATLTSANVDVTSS